MIEEIMKNTDLKQTYEEMHRQGPGAWFDDGKEERQAILDMGMPWSRKRVLEIGCGEGELLDMIGQAGAIVTGLDYSLEAITTAKNRFSYLDVLCCSWEEWPDSRNQKFDVIVMQGVLEHLDDPWQSLDGMIAKFQPETVITSMPCFLNPRGIVWMTLDMLGAVMSKTDLHFINPWEVRNYCHQNGHKVAYTSVDLEWAAGEKMADDLRQRIPLALKDGGMPFNNFNIECLLNWLTMQSYNKLCGATHGAVAIYRIDL